MYTLAGKGHPEKTLGWGVIDWCETFLAHPDGENAGDPWRFTNEQANFVLWWYAVDDDGVFLHDRSLLARSKGWGKSPVLAALCCAELLGPVRFAYFDDDGEPVGKPVASPHVQLVAVSAAQTGNTMSLVREMLALGRASQEYYLDLGRTRILTHHGILEPVTANAKSREGQRVTFGVFDETHLWLDSNKGRQLAEVIARNCVKMDARYVETTNAPLPGEGSVAENSFQLAANIAAGLNRDTRFLFDNRQADEDVPIAPGPARRAGLIEAYGDAARENGGWVNLDRVERAIDDPATGEANARRFYFNQLCRGSSQWLDKRAVEELMGFCYVANNEPIALGFDGSIRNDSTALVGCRLSDGFVWPIQVWEKPEGDLGRDWEVPFLEVDEVTRLTLDTYDVRWMYADPAYWQDIVGRWALDYPDVVFEFWTHRRSAMVQAIERFETAVNTRGLLISSADRDEVLVRHLLNAHEQEVPGGKLIRKETPKSDRKIDAAMAAVLAYQARGDAIEAGRLESDPEDSNTMFGF